MLLRRTCRSARPATVLAICLVAAQLLAGQRVSHAQLIASPPSLSAEMKAEFGAANWIPEEAGFFTAGYRYGEQWNAFKNSRAFRELSAMPGVQMGLMWFHQQPYLAQFEAARQQNPLIDQAVRVLSDAFGQEVFVYVDRRGPEFLESLSELYGTFYWGSMSMSFANALDGQIPDYVGDVRGQLIDVIRARRDQLRLPGIVFGFRLTDPQVASELIASVRPLAQQLCPFPLVQESIGGGEYLTLPLRAEMFFTPDRRAALEAELQMKIVDDQHIQDLLAFIDSQTLSISIGVRDDYLLISLGADNTHLEQLGKGQSLASSDALAPARKHFKKNLVGLTYVEARFTGSGKMDVGQWMESFEALSYTFALRDKLPDGMTERLLADAEQLLLEMNDHLPEAQPTVATSFWNQGYEAFSFSALAPGALDASQELSILQHAGKAPICALAGNSQPSLPHYERLAYWTELIYGYVDECIQHFAEPEDLPEIVEFQTLALPVVQQIHETTRDMLIPSIDGGQSLFVMDAGGAVTLSPQDKSRLPMPIRFPRPALLCEVNDPELLVAACSRYRQIFNELMTRVAAENPGVNEVYWPAPSSRNLGDGTLYTYTIPAEYPVAEYLNDDFEPHALLTEKHLALSLSTAQSAEMLQAGPRPDTQVIDLNQPSARVAWVDWSAFIKLLFDDTDAVLTLLGSQQQIEPAAAMMAKVHADKLRNALGAIRHYRSRTYAEDGRQVTHSWLHLRDVEP